MRAINRRLNWIFSFNDNQGDDEPETLEVPEDLSHLSVEELQTLEDSLLETFDAIRAEALSAASVAELRDISAAVDRIRAESSKREREREDLALEAAALANRVGLQDATETPTEPETPQEGEAAEGEASEGEGEGETGDAGDAGDGTVEAAAAAAKAPIQIKRKTLNVSMSEVQRRAPDPTLGTRQEATIVVAPDVPSVPAGTKLGGLEHLVDAVHRRARTLGNPSGQVTVATIKREFDIVLDRDAPPDAIADIVRRAADPAHLVAAGGWCAPSTIIYDFFNISCVDGLIDIPTVGVTRGGIRWPTSPSIQDVLANIWLWTETDDINAATGTSGPTKPCARVPCPSFNEDRLDCHGLCVTAGNLTESAYPELIANHISLTMDAHRHVMNTRFIADMVSLSTSVAITGTDVATSWGLLNAVGLQAADYREKYRMCESDVLEVVFPRWAKEAFRADLAKRTGTDNFLSVTDAQINAWFDLRNVRVQWVSDWQLSGPGLSIGGASAATGWPQLVQFMIFAAGTFVLGNGLDLDLGVVRDSTLNARNDHTAAWTEECHLLARIGHESRIVTVDHCVSGQTGAASATCGL